MNPSCACGCGYEVRLPTNKYIQGHCHYRKMDLRKKRLALKMLASGMSQAKVAQLFGVSQATICCIRFGDFSYIPQRAEKVVRQEEIEEWRAFSDARQKLRFVKKYLKEKWRHGKGSRLL